MVSIVLLFASFFLAFIVMFDFNYLFEVKFSRYPRFASLTQNREQNEVQKEKKQRKLTICYVIHMDKKYYLLSLTLILVGFSKP